MEPIKVVLWGCGAAYDLYYKLFQAELLKGNMEIVAAALDEEGMFAQIDGAPVIRIEEVLNLQYDYLVDMHTDQREAVESILKMLGIDRGKVMKVELFFFPFFDLKRWHAVKESNISIMAHNCWGGYTYHSLGLKFTSPFINMSLGTKSFLKILNRLDYYMQVEPHLAGERYSPVLKSNYPVMGLEDLELDLIHYTDFEEAVEIWKKRRKRINYDNLLSVMIIETEEDLDAFLKTPWQYKLGFSTVPCAEKEIIYFPAMKENGYLQTRYDGNFWDYINHMALNITDEFRQYDILKILNHEEDFRRAVMNP